MQQNFYPYQQYPSQTPNAVSINIISPQAYGANANQLQNQNVNPYGQNPYGQNYEYRVYGTNPNYLNPMPQYPYNYNNLMSDRALNGVPDKQKFNKNNEVNETNLLNKTDVPTQQNEIEQNKNESSKTKKIIPLTDDYIKSLENYLNNENPKVRLIGAKELVQRFKENDNRKDNPSLVALLNKALKDPSPSVRFLALTALQLGYSVGNDETVTILRDIQNSNPDKIGEDSLLASEILLKLAGGAPVDVPMSEEEILKEQQNLKNSKNNKNQGNQ